MLPPAWIPAVPALEYGTATAGGAPTIGGRTQRALRVRRLWATLVSALLALCCVLVLAGAVRVRSLGELLDEASTPPPTLGAPSAAARDAGPALPQLVAVSRDAAGSSIEKASFASAALGARGSFFVYLPPGFSRSASTRYPVLYLLHGREGHASAFLEIGTPHALDRLIAAGAIPPMIAVMIQDLPSLTNWRNIGRRRSESYVVEVQKLIDRMLPTIAKRSARAIAGSSMGGYGAMHVALENPTRFAVVESWLGFFNGLEGELRAAEPVIARLGLHAFLYGAEADPVAVPEEDPAFAAELSAAGASAEGVIFSGGHSLGKVREHLEAGLEFAGRALVEAQNEERIAAARFRWRA
jgi:enterochelin esterase-like enzyme